MSRSKKKMYGPWLPGLTYAQDTCVRALYRGWKLEGHLTPHPETLQALKRKGAIAEDGTLTGIGRVLGELADEFRE